jgi:hypothetical protein
MAKKSKTTLKDVSKFLKTKPSTLVDIKKPELQETEGEDSELSTIEELEYALIQVSEKQGVPVGNLLLDLCEKTLEDSENLSADELLLLNTIIYLKYT